MGTMEDSPEISSTMMDIDRVYIETGDKCSRCGEYEAGTLSVDHIDSDKSNSRYDNLLVLCNNCHQLKTRKTGLTIDDIRKLKAHFIRRTLTEYGISAIKLAARKPRVGIIAIPFLVEHMVDLGYLEKQEKQMGYSVNGGEIEATVRYTISEKGIIFFEQWKKYL